MSNDNNSELQLRKAKRKIFLIAMAQFLWRKKAYWIFPVVVFLILLIFLIAIGTSPVSPFIYTII